MFFVFTYFVKFALFLETSILNMKNKKNLSDFNFNENSPFIEEIIDLEISSRRRVVAVSAKNAEHNKMIVANSGEIVGEQVFAVLEKVDKEQFTKIFQKGVAGMFELSTKAIRVWGYITSIVKPNSDEIFFDIDDCKAFTQYKTHNPVNDALAELIENQFIARGNKHYKYYINPAMFFNGSRVSFLQSYMVEDNNEKINTSKLKINS